MRALAPFPVTATPPTQALTDGHYQSAVALYAAQLPTDAQVNSYAYLLAGETGCEGAVLMGGVVSGVQQEDQQRHCLQLGKEAGLDIAMVTKAVVENIRDREMVSCRHMMCI